MSWLVRFIAAVLCAVCASAMSLAGLSKDFSSRPPTAAHSSSSSDSFSGQTNRHRHRSLIKATGAACSACGFRLCHCITRPAATLRRASHALSHIVRETGTGFLRGSAMGFALSATVLPRDQWLEKAQSMVWQVGKFNALSRGCGATFEVFRGQDDDWNQVAANALTGAMMLTPEHTLKSRCLTAAYLGSVSYVLAKTRKTIVESMMPNVMASSPAWNEESAWESDRFASWSRQ